jgi:putative ABC transport system permease protein
MFKNYLAIFLRGFQKTALYSMLNIAGLALGIACAALIFLWIEDEFSYDHQYAKRDQLYGVRMNLDYSNKIESSTGVPWPLAGAIRTAIPEVVNTTRLGFDRDLFATNPATQPNPAPAANPSPDKSTYENGLCVDTGFFSMVQPIFIKGSTAGFTSLHTLILTETMAAKFFGSVDPMGKTLRVGNQQDYTVIGVVKDAPLNVSIRYDWLAPIQNFRNKNRWLGPWPSYGIITLVELRPDADINRVNSQMTAILRPKDPLYAKTSCQLWSLKDWHLRSRYTNGQPDGGLITIVHIVSVIGWIILLIACINFMNLSTARAGQRAREVGVRKTLGAMRKALIGQFLLESLIMSFVAVVLATILVYLALPGFNTLVDKQLTFSPFKPVHLAALIFIGIFCGLIAGSYPAFYLSSFDPVAVLKGQLTGQGTGGGAGLIRRGLVVTQFTFSVGLIVCTVIVNQQLQYLRSRDLGYNKEHLLFASLQGDLGDHFDALKADLLQTGVVANTAISHSPPLAAWSSNTSEQLTWPDASPDKKIQINWEWGSPEYFPTMGLQVKEGRNFYPDVKADSGDAIINETLAGIMGKDGRIGGSLTYLHRDRYRIIGIVKDYVFNDMRGNIAPLMLTCEPEVRRNYDFLEIRLKSGNDLPKALAKVEGVVKTINPGYPFVYHFVDEEFDHFFSIESRVGQFAGIFSLLAILISCLGLFGLAAYTAARRTKEIGIRKVLGASVVSVAALLSKEFLKLVALSCWIAFPLAGGFMDHWLKDFDYRTAIHWWIFALAGAAAILIALLTVSFLAVRAAMANPIQSLRTE